MRQNHVRLHGGKPQLVWVLMQPVVRIMILAGVCGTLVGPWASSPLMAQQTTNAQFAVIPGAGPGVLGSGSDIPLVLATRAGDASEVRALVRAGADVNAAEGDGMTALHWAAHTNQVEAARILIQAGASLNTRTRVGAHTPLLVASRLGNAEVVELLLAGGADVHTLSTSGGTSALHFAASAGNPRAVELLLAHGADVNQRENAYGNTPLMVAAASGRLEAVRVLLDAGADLHLESHVLDMAQREQEDREARALRTRRMNFEREQEERRNPRPAVEEEEAEVEEEAEGAGIADAELVEEEAEVDATESGEEKAEAAEEGENEVTEAGREDASADATEENEEAAQEEEEATPLSYADLVGGYGGLTALHLAIRQGHAPVASLLLDRGAHIDHVTGGDHTSPLLMAAVNGYWDLGVELVERGADPNLVSDAGAGPLYAVLNLQWAPNALYPQPRAQLVQEVDYLEAMRALLGAGANPNERLTKHLWYKSYNFDLLGIDTGGASPFWRAAYATDVRAMRLLLEFGADPHVATQKPAERRRGPDQEDQSGLPPLRVGAPSVTPLHAAAGAGYGEGFAANAHRHVPGGWLPAVSFLVEEVGLEVDARDHNGFTPLHHAASRGDLEVIQYLVDQGADVMVISRSGLTTADMANGPAQRVPPYPRAIALLRELGSDFNNRCLSC